MIMRRSFLVPIGLLLFGLGCFGTNKTSDRAGTLNGKMTILPEAPLLVAGETVQFSASTPWGSETTWSVSPATAGSISTSGLFTASGTPGNATVYAVWTKDVRYAASTPLIVMPPPAPAEISPNLAQTFGAQQTVPGTTIVNTAMAGAPIPATTATTANGGLQVRHGFDPPVK